jgi:hypothetical protein
MADPRSIAASIASLIQISATVIAFISQLSDAPKIAARVVSELRAMDIVLRSLEKLIKELDDKAQIGLFDIKTCVILGGLLTVLDDCVCTYNELKDTVERLNGRFSTSLGSTIIHNARWALKRGEINEIAAVLQNYKLSLTTILSTFTAYVRILLSFYYTSTA